MLYAVTDTEPIGSSFMPEGRGDPAPLQLSLATRSDTCMCLNLIFNAPLTLSLWWAGIGCTFRTFFAHFAACWVMSSRSRPILASRGDLYLDVDLFNLG